MKKGLGDAIRKLVTGTAIDKPAVEEVLKEMKRVLLQSDVDVKLLDDLLARIRKKCFDEKIPSGLTLREHVLKVIYEEMVNLLGEEGFTGVAQYEGLDDILAMEGVHIHLYGKKLTKPFRKMGHITLTDPDLEKLKEKAQIVKEKLKVKA